MTSIDDAREQAARARHDLATTLDAIEDKLNVPKRVAAQYRRNPIPVIIAGVAVVGAVAGLIAWAVAARRD